MDWLKGLLKKAGIEEAKVDSIVTDVGKELPKHAVPKDKYNELSGAKKKAEKDLTERDGQLEELGKAAGTSEELKKQIEQLQAANKEADEKHKAELKELTVTNAIKSALIGKVHDEGLAATLIDRGKLVIDGDKVIGLDEQMKTLQESKAFLFKSDESQQQKPGFRVGGGGQDTPPNHKSGSLLDAVSAHYNTK